MVSDSELVERLREFLRASDLSTTTTAIVRRKLEEDFGVDLSDKKAFIREQVDLFLHSELNDSREAEKEDGSGGDEGDQDGEEGSGDREEEEDDDDEDGDEEDEGRSNGGGTSRKRR